MRIVLLALSLAAFGLVLGEEPEPRWAALNHIAGQAIASKDYAKLRSTLDQLAPLMPGNPRILYNMAASDAVLAHRQLALNELQSLAAAGLIYDLDADTDFANVRTAPEYRAVQQRMQHNKQPVSSGVPAFTFSETDLLPEDITYDRKQRDFLISSVTGSRIIHADGKLLAKSPAWSIMALRIDPKRRILWAASAWLPHCRQCRPEDKDKTALLSFQLDSGALLGQYPSPVPGMFGDMTISRKGDIYVSEGIHGAVFRFANNKFERLDTPGEFPSPQTPALSADERTLYIPDYARGIAAMNLASRRVEWLQPAQNVIDTGIDGLYVYHNSFLAVQNGTNPPRIIRFSLDLQRQQILEANTPGLGEPTHGTLVGDSFYFLANTGWSEYGQDGKKKPGSQPVVSTVRKISLKPQF